MEKKRGVRGAPNTSGERQPTYNIHAGTNAEIETGIFFLLKMEQCMSCQNARPNPPFVCVGFFPLFRPKPSNPQACSAIPL